MHLNQRLEINELLILNLQEKNEKNDLLTVERIEEINQWKNSLTNNDFGEINILKTQNDTHKRELIEGKSKFNQLLGENKILEANLDHLMNELNDKKEELKSCYDLIEEMKNYDDGISKTADEYRNELLLLKIKVSI